MKLYIAVCFLIFAQVASADEVININTQTDEAFENLNKFLTHAGFGSVPIPPVIRPEIRLLKGVSIGANSLQRLGDAIISVNNETKEVSLDLHIGQRLLAAAYGIIDFGDGELSGLTRIRNNSFHYALTVATNPRCRVTLDSFEYETLTDVSFQSTAEKYDNVDISSIFTEHVLPAANEAFSQAKPFVEKELEKLICRNRLDFLQAHHLATVFKASFPKL